MLQLTDWHLYVSKWRRTQSRLLLSAGLLGSALATTWGALLLMVFSASAAVAVGMPMLLLPAPMLAASGLAMFQVSWVSEYASARVEGLGTGLGL